MASTLGLLAIIALVLCLVDAMGHCPPWVWGLLLSIIAIATHASGLGLRL